ncbi:hypothetical protein [Cognatiluteimonas weifangensis]|uniref:Polymer-forming cytoskeletal protein n=1 Tax=Cognatiluteimonas weifangensis TaxID=2303539 RepID=A0A372DHR9_9GAMM|nr:hypothetical protein [Luteimonas weifangensis]RFP59095.1 hypothetical protein D0Y53_11700 [Luteimonas weifangensis]
MPRTRLALALALALFAAAPAFAQGQDIDKINGSITATAGQRYGDLETVNGSIRLQAGAQAADVETVNGSIHGEDDVRAQTLSTVNGGIRLGRRAQVEAGIETVNGAIFLDRGSRVGGDVATVNGGIGLVDTDLAGDIATVSGDITVGAGSHVKGGIRVDKPNRGGVHVRLGRQRAPKIVIGPDAVVEGPLVFEREVRLYVHASARIGSVRGATAVRYSTPTPPADE